MRGPGRQDPPGRRPRRAVVETSHPGTTHVLSSGVAGTMAANRSGLQGPTVRSIAPAWLPALPAAMAPSAAPSRLSRPGVRRWARPRGRVREI
jgi:hypothetical protein